MVWIPAGDHDPVKKWMDDWEDRNIPRATLQAVWSLVVHRNLRAPAEVFAQLLIKQQADFAVHTAKGFLECFNDLLSAVTSRRSGRS